MLNCNPYGTEEKTCLPFKFCQRHGKCFRQCCFNSSLIPSNKCCQSRENKSENLKFSTGNLQLLSFMMGSKISNMSNKRMKCRKPKTCFVNLSCTNRYLLLLRNMLSSVTKLHNSQFIQSLNVKICCQPET